MSHAPHDATFHELYFEYFDHWNAERFWEAHESLEELWRQTQDANRLFLQGLIQAAGAFHHVARGRWDPARVLFGQSLAYLETYEPFGVWEGLEVAPVCELLRDWGARARRRVAGEESGEAPPRPRIGPLPEYVARFAPTER